MVLLPPAYALDTRPIYHVSVAMNCFNPLVHTTTIKRGGVENGGNVGHFEMGISSKPSRIRFRGQQYLTKDVLEAQHHNGYRNNGWYWDLKQPNAPVLVWTFVASSEKALCRLNDEQRTLVAEYIVPEPDPNEEIDFAMRELDIHGPLGYRYLDDILMSILVIERKRSIPSDGNVKRVINS
ncbi:hypothetical protein BDQ17DRAFT_1361853 [Cyathus striatus]|nr:hypothetical protein BDQ17DRAFT_1361853 [Cyathus striatus]